MQVDLVASLLALGGIISAVGVLYKTQTNSYENLVKRLIENIDKLKSEQDKLREKVASLENQLDELKDSKNLFNTALDYIRDICSWLDNKGLDASEKPFMPPSLKKHYGPFVMRNHKEKE